MNLFNNLGDCFAFNELANQMGLLRFARNDEGTAGIANGVCNDRVNGFDGVQWLAMT